MVNKNWLIFASIFTVLSGCGGGGNDGPEPSSEELSFAITTNTSNGGTISPVSANVLQNSQAKFTIKADIGYQIESVSGCDGSLSGDQYTTGRVYSSCEVTAQFSSIQHIVSARSEKGGHISPTSQNINHGSTATFTIKPDNGHGIDDVTGCNGTLSGTTYVTAEITEPCDVVASFKLNQYSITTNSTSGGSISPESATVQFGDSVEFKISPQMGHIIDQVAGCNGTLKGNIFTTNSITSNCEVNATFKAKDILITTNAGDGGSIYPENQTVKYGDSTSFKILPDHNFEILDITGCDGVLEAKKFTLNNITETCELNAFFNAKPMINIGGPIDLTETKTIEHTVSVDDIDSEIASYQWQQVTGPEFSIHQSQSSTLIATAPLVEKQVDVSFELTVFDKQGASSKATLVVTVNPIPEDLININPIFDLPSDISSITNRDLSLSSLASQNNQVANTNDSTLLIAKDRDGSVLLAVANKNGGYFGETNSDVKLNIESTASTLIAVAAGHPISSINQSLILEIQNHQQFHELLLQLSALIDADKNFLDRLYDYPDIVKNIKSIARSENISQQSTKYQKLQFSKPTDKIKNFPLKDDYHITNTPISPSTKQGFYCTWVKWPCSPWYNDEEWLWFGDAKGIKAFYPDDPETLAKLMLLAPFNSSLAVNYVSGDGYIELLEEATKLPFLARSLNNSTLHAIANPNFANYAMELYEDEIFKGWYYTPRNSTMIQKMLHSGAAYRPLLVSNEALFNQNINNIRFTRYRFSIDNINSENSYRAPAISFVNTIGALASGINLFADAAALAGWVFELPVDKLAPVIADCALDVTASIDVYEDITATNTIDKAFSFIKSNSASLFETIPKNDSCLYLGKKLGGKTLKKVLEKQSVRAGVEFIANATPAGWVKLAFDGVNDTIPVFTSFLSNSASSIQYNLDWETDSTGNAYIASITPFELPKASFTYKQSDSYTIEFDASKSLSDSSTSLEYKWIFNELVISKEKTFSHDFNKSGLFDIRLEIVDKLGNRSNITNRIQVGKGHSPEIISLTCSSLGNGNAKVIVDFRDDDNNVSKIHWFNDISSSVPFVSKTSQDANATIPFESNLKYAFAKVKIEDSDGNTDESNCIVSPNELVAGKYVITVNTVIDTETDLEWQRCYVGQIWDGSTCLNNAQNFVWQEAFDAANNNNLNNKKDWRLPTAQELLTLVYCSSGQPTYWKSSDEICEGEFLQPTLHPEAFPNPASYSSWSGELESYQPISWYAKVLGLHYGNIGRALTASNARGYSLRLVRNIKPSSNNTLTMLKWSNPYESDTKFNQVEINPSGEICGQNCTLMELPFETNDKINLQAILGENWASVDWLGDCSGQENICNLTMDKPRLVIAKFLLPWNKNNLTIYIEGNGSGAVEYSYSSIVNSCTESCTIPLDKNTKVTLTATPDQGYKFAGWSGACAGTSTTCTVTMDSAKKVTAVFIDGVVRDKVLNVCDTWSAAQSGGHGTTVDHWDISQIPSNAVFDIKFDTQSVPDKLTVAYENTEQLDTGWRGSSKYEGDPLYPGGISGPGVGQEDNIFRKYSSNTFNVTVFGPEDGTQWDYSVRCRLD